LSQLRQDIEQFRTSGAQVVAVAPDQPQGVAKFTRENPYPFPILADADHSVFDAYDVVSRMASLGQRPAVFIVDRDQKVAYESIGTQQWQIPGNSAVLDEVSRLAGSGTS
jgi:peroxiredoxin Q/BCP